MIANFLIFDRAGSILQTGSVPTSMLNLQGSEEGGRFVLEGIADMQLDMVLNGAVCRRPPMPAQFSSLAVLADAADKIVMARVPSGTAIKIIGPVPLSGVADGTEIALTFSVAGAYVVRLELFPFIDMEVKINAT